MHYTDYEIIKNGLKELVLRIQFKFITTQEYFSIINYKNIPKNNTIDI
jgi:hypothetical protein